MNTTQKLYNQILEQESLDYRKYDSMEVEENGWVMEILVIISFLVAMGIVGLLMIALN